MIVLKISVRFHANGTVTRISFMRIYASYCRFSSLVRQAYDVFKNLPFVPYIEIHYISG